jgi:hypothetical protein
MRGFLLLKQLESFQSVKRSESADLTLADPQPKLKGFKEGLDLLYQLL